MHLSNDYTIFKNLIFYTFVLILAVFIYQIQSIVILFFGAFILASAIDPLIKIMSKKMPRKAALALFAIIGAVIIMIFLVPFINIIAEETNAFLKDFPKYSQNISSLASNGKSESIVRILKSPVISKWMDYAKNMGIIPEMKQITSFFSNIAKYLVSNSLDFTKNFLTSVMFVFTLAMLTLFMLVDKNYLAAKFFSFFPENIRGKATEISKSISKKAGGYVLSQLIIITAISLLVSIGLSVLKIKYALIIGMIAGILELIPVIGPMITAILIILAALVQKPVLIIFGLLLYGAIQWGVDNILRPYVMSKFLEMHPLTFIFSLFIGGTFWGITGLILAPAIAAVVCVLIDELYLSKVNNCKPVNPEL